MQHIYSALFGGRDVFPFESLLAPEHADNISVVREPDELKISNSALIIWGGADINPEFYRHPKHPTTHPGGLRDKLEWALLERAVEMGIAVIGVCRGAQMLCARAGGWLIQDVRGHMGSHWVRTNTDDLFMTNSIHHQMMAGLGTVDHELVAWSDKRLAVAGYGYMDNKLYEPPQGFREPEFVFFPKIRGYAIQWHPEGMPENSSATQFVLRYIRKKEKELSEGFATATVEITNGHR